MSNILLGRFQKQSSGGFPFKRCSREFRKNSQEISSTQAFSYEFGESFKNTSGRLLGFSLFEERFLTMHFFL